MSEKEYLLGHMLCLNSTVCQRPMETAAYLSVSTTDQHADLQHRGITCFAERMGTTSKLRVLPLLMILFLVESAQGQRQPFRFEHLTVEDGLSSNHLTAVLQDRRGYLWLGTFGSGLLRYDGYEVKVYRHVAGDSTSLSHDLVTGIRESRDGALWVRTAGGLARFDPQVETFRTYRHRLGDPVSLSADDLGAIYESRDGILWVGTMGGGLNRFDPQAQTFRTYRYRPGDPSSLSHDVVWTIREAHDRSWSTSQHRPGCSNAGCLCGSY